MFSRPNISFFHLLVVLLIPYLLTTPYLPYIGGRYRWAGRNLNGISQRTICYGASKDLILVNTVQLKSMIKVHSSGRMVSSGISDVVIASGHSEKTRLKKLMMIMMMKMIITIIIIIIIMNKSQEMTVFRGHQKLTSAMKLRPEK